MRSASSPRAVSMITGSSERLRIQRQSSSPSMPGSIRSSTTSVGGSCSTSSRARSPSAGLERAITLALEIAADDLTDDRLVVDDEDGRHVRSQAHECYGRLKSAPGRGTFRLRRAGARGRARSRRARRGSSARHGIGVERGGALRRPPRRLAGRARDAGGTSPRTAPAGAAARSGVPRDGQARASGQSPQRGTRARQTVAPRSMSACAARAAERAGRCARAPARR